MNKEKIKSYIVNKVTVNQNKCWIWNGTPRENGYCRTSVKRKSWYLHRLSYFAFVGDIPDGYDVCHKCDVRNCCNPQHLFSGTRKDNMQDAVKKNRQSKGMMLPHARLTKEDKTEILDMARAGMHYKDIAKKYGVTRHSIGRVAILNGIRRK